MRNQAVMTGSKPFSVYVHIPFCRTRCAYCAFNTYVGLDALIEPYTDALTREMALLAEDTELLQAHTLYLGGGTPSLLSPAQVEAIVGAAVRHLRLQAGAEITLEANPGSASPQALAGYRSAGVNRLSLGVQSTHESELKLFGRRHTFEDAAMTFQQARGAGFEAISVDLIYGAPTQTLHSWCKTLGAVLAWEPEHVSLYSLTLEPGTPLHQRVERGEVSPPDPDLAADMYEDACELLDRAGLQHYEISNWARPGHECAHNRQYWLNLPFLGFGAGAHGGAAGLRYWNVASVETYIERVRQGKPQPFPLTPAVDGYEQIDRPTEMSETLILGLRLVQEGISSAAFAQRYGCTPDDLFGPEIRELEQLGLLERQGDRIRLSRRGYLLSNQVFVRLLPEDS